MTEAVANGPTPAQAAFMAAALLARTGMTRSVFTPIWAACPELGFGDRSALPTLRSDATDRLLGWGQRVTWRFAFLHLVAESAHGLARTRAARDSS